MVHAFHWSKMSIAAALGYRWDGRRGRLFFQTRRGSYNSESLIIFLKELRRELRGRKAVLVWDGLLAHKRRRMQAYLRQQRRWLRAEKLPGDAHDLTPLKPHCGNLKGQVFANRCAD